MNDKLPTTAADAGATRFTSEEWAARVQLAAAYRIFEHLGWGELIYNHISMRVPARCSSSAPTSASS